MNKFDFQTSAQDQLAESAIKLLGRTGPSSITFRAPTGAGKTVMMANTLAQLARACEGTHSLAILWVAPNKLHEQSHDRLLQVYDKSQALACLYPEELAGTEIPEKTVLFLNWASIDSDKLVLRRKSETGRNLESFVSNARMLGRKVVLVVDESHLHLNSGAQAQVVIDHIIRPDLVIEVSATPRDTAPDATVTVLREDVVAAGLIRKQIIVNPDMDVCTIDDDLVVHYTGTSENLLDLALAKQAALTRMYQAEGSPVVPLILIQLPSKSIDKDALGRLEQHLGIKHKLYRGAGLEVWLAEDQTEGLADIASFKSTARVLFFKQGIATGWDCPRAQILVGLREMKSETFSSQVLGRIIRQPEHKHYGSEALNYGYAFTNYDRLKLDAESATWMGKAMVRAKADFCLPFPNWKRVNVDRRFHLTSAAIKAMLEYRGLLSEVEHRGPVTTRILAQLEIDDLDTAREEVGTRVVALDLEGLQTSLDGKKSDLVREFASQIHGRKRIEGALRKCASEIVSTTDEQVLLETILHPDNWDSFKAMVVRGINDFKATQEKAAQSLELRDSWTAPDTRFIELSEPLDGYERCLYTPVLQGQFDRSDVERPFTEWLDSQAGVAVWLKNGDHGTEHFAIRYELDGERLFYPDFLIKLTDGTVCLFDTKGAGKSDLSTGNTDDTHAKARALQAYVEKRRAEGYRVRCGMVVKKNGLWWVHEGEDYPGTVEVSEANGWKLLSLEDEAA